MPQGANTAVDDRGRLVHRSQYVPVPNCKESPAQLVNEPQPSPPDGASPEPSADSKHVPTRKSSRLERPVDRLVVGFP